MQSAARELHGAQVRRDRRELADDDDGQDHEGRPVVTTRFMGLDLATDADVLVPRAETELLAKTALDLLDASTNGDGTTRVIDMCCGAGNLACALANARPSVEVWASDLTEPCVRLA